MTNKLFLYLKFDKATVIALNFKFKLIRVRVHTFETQIRLIDTFVFILKKLYKNYYVYLFV